MWFGIGNGKSIGAKSDKLPYCDFTVKKEHHFLRNIFTESELESSPTIQNLENYYEFFEKFMWISANLVTKKYLAKTNNEDIEDGLIMEDFMNQGDFETFDELFTLISQLKVKNITAKKQKCSNFKQFLLYTNSFLIFQV